MVNYKRNIRFFKTLIVLASCSKPEISFTKLILFFIPFSIMLLFLVSNEINLFNFLTLRKVGKILFHSLSASTSFDPGLVASPPISKILHPSLNNLFACFHHNFFY